MQPTDFSPVSQRCVDLRDRRRRGSGPARATRAARQQDQAQKSSAAPRVGAGAPTTTGQPLLVVPSAHRRRRRAPRIDPELPMVELLPLLQRVERASSKQFLVDGRLGPRIYLGGVEPNDVTYPALLAILASMASQHSRAKDASISSPTPNIRFHEPRIAQPMTSRSPPRLRHAHYQDREHNRRSWCRSCGRCCLSRLT